MLVQIKECPICKNGQFSNVLMSIDHTVSNEKFQLVKCEHCDFVFTNPRPRSNDLSKYYESTDYISHQNKGNNLVNIIYQIARNFTLKGKIKLIEKHHKKGNLLDIGCGTGHFLELAKAHGWQVQGIEPGEQAREQVIKKEIDVISDIMELPSSNSYDIITMWHVLEHIIDINQLLEKVYDLLNNNGTYIVAVPNMQSFDAQHYQDYWAAYDVPRHLYHFTQNTMSEIMKKHGFKIIDTKPMKLDAYYVAMLSEKHKNNGSNNYVKAIINGYKSNSYAKKHTNNYSSLIYIIQKG